MRYFSVQYFEGDESDIQTLSERDKYVYPKIKEFIKEFENER